MQNISAILHWLETETLTNELWSECQWDLWCFTSLSITDVIQNDYKISTTLVGISFQQFKSDTGRSESSGPLSPWSRSGWEMWSLTPPACWGGRRHRPPRLCPVVGWAAPAGLAAAGRWWCCWIHGDRGGPGAPRPEDAFHSLPEPTLGPAGRAGRSRPGRLGGTCWACLLNWLPWKHRGGADVNLQFLEMLKSQIK